MGPALISLHRQGVFRQPWFILTSITSDFSLSLVDYFPLIPKVHKIAVVSVAIHTFRNNYPSAVDNRFICSLLDKDFCAVKRKQNKTKTSKSNMNFLIGVPNTVGWLGEAKVSCILRHRGVQLIFAYSWAKVEGECFYFFCFFNFIHFSFSCPPTPPPPTPSFISSTTRASQ